jgi:hypothetical protein
MMSGHELHFTHRENEDLTWDSICTVCFGTITTKDSESELVGVEAAHLCAHLGGTPAWFEFGT